MLEQGNASETSTKKGLRLNPFRQIPYNVGTKPLITIKSLFLSDTIYNSIKHQIYTEILKGNHERNKCLSVGSYKEWTKIKILICFKLMKYIKSTKQRIGSTKDSTLRKASSFASELFGLLHEIINSLIN